MVTISRFDHMIGENQQLQASLALGAGRERPWERGWKKTSHGQCEVPFITPSGFSHITLYTSCNRQLKNKYGGLDETRIFAKITVRNTNEERERNLIKLFLFMKKV